MNAGRVRLPGAVSVVATLLAVLLLAGCVRPSLSPEVVATASDAVAAALTAIDVVVRDDY